ncbi:MAG: hypothetical protein MUF49_27055 [Oculatellaceae cyanobacterium Prado106]|jgi:hypothetical protein|nr:hypothetical protein [Oculatellaceae cyanobacterium Prado106]
MMFGHSIRGIHDIRRVGVPIFRNAGGGDQTAQQRNMALGSANQNQ